MNPSPIYREQTPQTDMSPQVLFEAEHTIALLGEGASSDNLAVSFGYSFHIIRASQIKHLHEQIKEKNIDLLILSTQQGKVSWEKQLKALQADPKLKSIPVIVLSQDNSVNQQLVALELGALDCLATPSNPFLLYAKVNNYLKFIQTIKEQ